MAWCERRFIIKAVNQKFGALALAERRLAPLRNRKIKQIPHSNFGYVQDDECTQGTNDSLR
jgi:hypothetical protein